MPPSRFYAALDGFEVPVRFLWLPPPINPVKRVPKLEVIDEEDEDDETVQDMKVMRPTD